MHTQELVIETTGWTPADADLLVSMLDILGFEGILEEENCIKAYIVAEISEREKIIAELRTELHGKKLAYSWNSIEDKNWNSIWESNFQPVTIAGQCHIRASFHPANHTVPYEIIIDPKMAFGTGHHETTSMMVRLILENDFPGKSVLDMGCGTGVLAILAKMKGAGEVVAVDNDEWAAENARSNVKLNNASDIRVYLGGASLLENMSFDIIFANINRNILLNDMSAYAGALQENGKILLSGFHVEDLPVLEGKAGTLNLKRKHVITENQWMAALFEKTRS